MTQTSQQTTLDEAASLAEDLLSALTGDDVESAGHLAARLRTMGIQSLRRLTPRGTLQFPAVNRLDVRLTQVLLEQAKSRDLPEPLIANILGALGCWAGGEAVAGIQELLLRRIRGEHLSPPAADTIRSGLFALHWIGGPQAVQVLRDFQKADIPEAIRAQANWDLNELGERIVDLMFGSESLPEPLSAEEVHCRDNLQDPYAWPAAAEALWEVLVSLSRSYWLRYEQELSHKYPARAGAALRLAFGNRNPVEPDSQEWVRDLEPTLPAFMIRFPQEKVLALDAALRFFPAEDVLDSKRNRLLEHWSIVQLRPTSASARCLGQWSLFNAPDAGSQMEDSDLRRALRSWLGQLAFLARGFARQRQAPLVFSMAAMQDHLHEELKFPRTLPFPDLVQAMFRSFPSD